MKKILYLTTLLMFLLCTATDCTNNYFDYVNTPPEIKGVGVGFDKTDTLKMQGYARNGVIRQFSIEDFNGNMKRLNFHISENLEVYFLLADGSRGERLPQSMDVDIKAEKFEKPITVLLVPQKEGMHTFAITAADHFGKSTRSKDYQLYSYYNWRNEVRMESEKIAIIDTAKIGWTVLPNLNFTVFDINKNTQKIKIIADNKMKFKVGSKSVSEFVVDYNAIGGEEILTVKDLQFLPHRTDTVGQLKKMKQCLVNSDVNHSIKIYAYNYFGDSLLLGEKKILTFINWPPVIRLTAGTAQSDSVSFVDRNGEDMFWFLYNVTPSYDTDGRYGGKITKRGDGTLYDEEQKALWLTIDQPVRDEYWNDANFNGKSLCTHQVGIGRRYYPVTIDGVEIMVQSESFRKLFWVTDNDGANSDTIEIRVPFERYFADKYSKAMPLKDSDIGGLPSSYKQICQ